MEDLLKQVLDFAEGNAKWLDDAAKHFEILAAQLAEDEKSKWHLLAAVYRERAQACGNMLRQMRKRSTADGSSQSRLQNS